MQNLLDLFLPVSENFRWKLYILSTEKIHVIWKGTIFLKEKSSSKHHLGGGFKDFLFLPLFG